MNWMVLDTRTDERGTVEDWIAAFTWVWEAPRERLDRLMALLAPDIVLKAPTTPPVTSGQVAGRRAFERAFRAMPDLRAEIHRWAAGDDVLYIDLTFHATIGGRETAWDDVDRFVFRDGRAVERVAYFDSRKVRRAFSHNPAAWWQLLRLRTGW